MCQERKIYKILLEIKLFLIAYIIIMCLYIYY